MSEVQRGLIRITSNFVRFASGMILGLIFVRLILSAVGNEAVGVILLLVSTTGLTTMVREVINNSMIRELGKAYHDPDHDNFEPVLNAASIVCAAGSVLTLFAFVLLYVLLDFLNIPADLQDAARWMVVAKACEAFVLIISAPQFNMYMISERMIAFNGWMIADRLTMVVPAVVLAYMMDVDPASGIIIFGVSSAVLKILVQLLSVGIIVYRDRRLFPSPRYATREAFQAILYTGKWNMAVIIATNIHERVSAIIMNLAFGVIGNMIFGFALQLSGYIRIMVAAATYGIDAVATRMSSLGDVEKIRLLVRYSTRLHCMIAFPTFLGVWILAEPLLTVWVGGRLENPQANVPPTVVLIRILSLGIVARAISDGWLLILYGAGYIRKYAPIVMLGGLANPVLCLLLLWILPDSVRYTATSWPFAAIFLIVHMGMISIIGSRLLVVSLNDLLRGMLRPLGLSLACSPILWWMLWNVEHWNLWRLGGVVLLYGGIYVLLSYFVVLNRRERQQLIEAGLRRRVSEMDHFPLPETQDTSDSL